MRVFANNWKQQLVQRLLVKKLISIRRLQLKQINVEDYIFKKFRRVHHTSRN